MQADQAPISQGFLYHLPLKDRMAAILARVKGGFERPSGGSLENQSIAYANSPARSTVAWLSLNCFAISSDARTSLLTRNLNL